VDGASISVRSFGWAGWSLGGRGGDWVDGAEFGASRRNETEIDDVSISVVFFRRAGWGLGVGRLSIVVYKPYFPLREYFLCLGSRASRWH